MNASTLAAVVQAEVLGVKPSDPATLTARLDALESLVRALQREIKFVQALFLERDAAHAAERARYRHELGIQEAA